MTGVDFIRALEEIIRERMASGIADSYTARLVDEGVRRIAQKVGEEAIEVALASAQGDRDETIGEAADLVYHLLVLLNAQGIRLDDVAAVLEQRHRN